MPVTVDHRTDSGMFSSVSSASWNHTVGTGLTNSVLTVQAHTNGDASAPSTVQWDTLGTPVSLTKLGRQAVSSSNVSLWLLTSPSSGTKRITASLNTTETECGFGSSSYQNVNQSTPWNAASPQSSTGTVSGTTQSLTVTSATNEMAIAMIAVENNDTPTASGSQTIIHQGSITVSGSASEDLAGAASVSMGFGSLTNGDVFCMIGGSLQFAASTNVTPNVGQLTLTGFAPSVFSGLVPSPGLLTLTGFAPLVSTGPLLIPGIGQLVLTGYPPTILIPTPTQISLIAYQQSAAPTLTLDTSPSPADLSVAPPASPTPGPVSATVVTTPSLRMQLPNAPKSYDPVDQAQLRLAIMEFTQRFSEQTAVLGTDILVQIIQLDPSPLSDAGVNLRFQVHAIDPKQQTIQLQIVGIQGMPSPFTFAIPAIVSGPALGVLTTNDQIWKVSLPGPGAGPGTVMVRAQTADGRHTDVSIPLPASTTVALPQGAVTVLANGSWSAIVDLPLNVHSVKYLINTTGFVSDATVLGSGTLRSSITSPISFASPGDGAVLAFGQAVYISLVPFTGTSGGGSQMPSVHVLGAHETFSTNKTLSFSRSAWQEMTSVGFTRDSNFQPQNPALPGGGGAQVIAFTAIVPAGCTLLNAFFPCIWNTAGTAMGFWDLGFYLNNVLLNFSVPTFAAGQQTVNVSLGSTLVPTQEAIMFWSEWAGPVGIGPAATVGQGLLQDTYVVYSMPDPLKTV